MPETSRSPISFSTVPANPACRLFSRCHSEERSDEESLFLSSPPRVHGLPDTLIASGAASLCSDSGAAISQSQPSFRQVRTASVFVRFSTMNGAPHFGQGSAIGLYAVVKSHWGSDYSRRRPGAVLSWPCAPPVRPCRISD